MSTDHNGHRKQLQNAFDKFDLPKALEALESLSTEEVIAAFAAKLAQPGAFQIRGNRTKRNEFYDSLLNAPVMTNHHAQAQPFARDLNDKIQIIERSFDETRSSLPKCDISKFPEDIQFWSHVERASRELKDLHDAAQQAMAEIEVRAKANLQFAMPEMVIVKLPDGNEVNVDAAYSNIISSLSLTLKMLSFEHNLLSEGKLLAPQKVAITDEHIFKAGSIQLYAITWNALEDIANRTLFFGGEITSMENAGIPRSSLPEDFYSKFADPLFFHREPSEVEVYDFLANRRLHSWAVQNTIRFIQGANQLIPVMAKGAVAPSLSGGPFVSKEEGIALATLAEILSFDVFSDQERYHGLTLREWVRGYCSLKLLAEAKQADSCLVMFDKAELEQGFSDYQIPALHIPTLIHHLTFGQDSRDLYDSPLIRSQDGKYSLLADVLITCNLPNVLFSRLSSLDTQFEKKGKGFEGKVVSFFHERDYQCKATSFSIDHAQYEYDALLLLDDTLFLVECKNTLLSGNHAVQALRYSKFIDDTVKQVKRLERGLRARPEVVESLFDRKLSELTVVPVILNSMNYSRQPIDGVYISDYSALGKFFDESTISEFHWKDGEKKMRKIIHRLWSGERPTSQELLEYLSFPPQLKLIMEHLTYLPYARPTSESSVFISRVLDVDEPAMLRAKQEAPAVA
ncbi:hypothetical protein GCM10007907_00730 [Chitinimonas prasina]|uniref:NERD domain-containing protein n=1 Tax=Chitinimonas prasina TaxID=1434937 RepID=A0ABQ5YB86_9NEIS|nr:hypothetical protein [Chitinimonas prasina]GLR11283.1 hypothetical protein GCM10007907_00730 [Chitinimonas prasina]